MLPTSRSNAGKMLDVWRLPVKPRSVYLAASINARAEMVACAYDLLRAGIETTGGWILDKDGFASKFKDWQLHSYREKMGLRDCADIDRADVVIMCPNVEPSTSGGLHVELGYALAKGKPIVLIGERPNVFYYNPAIMVMPFSVDWREDLVRFLSLGEHGQPSYQVDDANEDDLDVSDDVPEEDAMASARKRSDDAIFAMISDELKNARKKFPGNRRTFTALVEEVGEVAQALLKNDGVAFEAIQVAAMAVRLIGEGDSDYEYLPRPAVRYPREEEKKKDAAS